MLIQWSESMNISKVTLWCDTDANVSQQHSSKQQTSHGVDAFGPKHTQQATLDWCCYHTAAFKRSSTSPFKCHDAGTIYDISKHNKDRKATLHGLTQSVYGFFFFFFVAVHAQKLSWQNTEDHFTNVPDLSVLWYCVSLYNIRFSMLLMWQTIHWTVTIKSP